MQSNMSANKSANKSTNKSANKHRYCTYKPPEEYDKLYTTFHCTFNIELKRL